MACAKASTPLVVGGSVVVGPRPVSTTGGLAAVAGAAGAPSLVAAKKSMVVQSSKPIISAAFPSTNPQVPPQTPGQSPDPVMTSPATTLSTPRYLPIWTLFHQEPAPETALSTTNPRLPFTQPSPDRGKVRPPRRPELCQRRRSTRCRRDDEIRSSSPFRRCGQSDMTSCSDVCSAVLSTATPDFQPFVRTA